MISMAFAMPDHLTDPSWPAHAKTHLAQSLVWLQGMGFIGLILAIKLSRSGSNFVWTLHLLLGIIIFGGYFLGILVTGGGAPGLRDDIFFVILWVIHLVSLFGIRPFLNK